MARTTVTLVEGVLMADYDGTSSLTPFIDTASAIVDRVAACAILKAMTLSAGELELIERWLAAHAYTMSDQTYASEATAQASGSYHGKTGMHFEATKYGQMAVTLDPSGCLASLGKQQRGRAVWLGKRPSEQTPYSERD